MMKLLAFLLLGVASATIYFQEDFSDDGWRSRWVDSTKKGASQGKFEWSAGSYYADASKGKGLMCSEDMRFYTTTASFPEFSNKGKKLVFQFTARLPKKFDCGGAYMKLYPAGLDSKTMDGDALYNIMFGPDICGYQCVFGVNFLTRIGRPRSMPFSTTRARILRRKRRSSLAIAIRTSTPTSTLSS
jgi:calreticulin